MNNEVYKYKYFFGCLQRTGGVAMKRLLEAYGDEVLLYKVSDKEIKTCGLLTAKQADELVERRKSIDIDREYDIAVNKGVKMVALTDRDYPRRLVNINSLPYMLFYYGELPEEEKPSIAIIGARMCSEYGRSMAKYFAEGLSRHGIQVVSGLASGIDGISQQASIESGGRSFGILGSGIDICYPASNRELYEKLKANGGIISEFPLGTKPIAQNFPMRNRIISGLSDVILVIEAKPRSGTAITVSMALEQGRQVYAVPGRINDALSQGCNHMIYEGAGIATDIDVILDELDRLCSVNPVCSDGMDTGSIPVSIKQEIAFENEMERVIYQSIENGYKDVEGIYQYIREHDEKNQEVTIEEIRATLMYMTLRGIVKDSLGEYIIT